MSESNKSLHLRIIATDRIIVDETVDYILVPLEDGGLGILPNHCPVLGALKEGQVKYTKNNIDNYVDISDGILNVFQNEVTLTVNHASSAETDMS